MWCCAECFGDRGLRHDIIPLRAIETGQCQFCGTDATALLEPEQLYEYFELLISAYHPDPKGKLLVQLFREDWGIFDHPRMDDPHAKELLGEILDDGDIVRRLYSPLSVVDTDRLGQWEKLREELMYQNRFFPDASFDQERLEHLLSYLSVRKGEVPDVWYRARMKIEDDPFTIDKMGVPPRRIASHGRANPAGIPYLYLGSSPKNAVSEIRPHTGERACVADFRTQVPPALKLVDLRKPRKTVSPFYLGDPEDIARMRNDLPFLERLGLELTTPVLPQAAAVDYTPSQYLCEFIKQCKYDGVIYRSSVCEDGINLALFYPAKAVPGTVVEYQVSSVSVDVNRV
jgi:hypothetical protein